MIMELARAALEPMQEMLARYPLGFAQWLIALDHVLSHPREIAIVGNRSAAATRALLEICRAGYRLRQVLALGEPGAGLARSHYCRTEIRSMAMPQPMCASIRSAERQ
jgi:uncharacterized protein YyaL (SSP411 family)